MNLTGLAIAFALIALIYASAGFGGGSSYIALLVMLKVPLEQIPIIALVCNIIVVSGSSLHYIRAGYLDKKILIWLCAGSIPMSYLGGQLMIEKGTFILILCLGLLISSMALFCQALYRPEQPPHPRPLARGAILMLGAGLGGLAGITGIGGGIFLSPLLFNLRAVPAKTIAAITSMFILLNSLSGLVGQMQKADIIGSLAVYWPLPLAAFVGGQIGSQITLRWLPARGLMVLTAILVGGVGLHLAWRLASG